MNAVSADELRNMGAMVLRMGSGSVAGMRPVMWPYMLELILPEPYTDAVGNICLSIANILKGDMNGLITDLNYDEMGRFDVENTCLGSVLSTRSTPPVQ